jgi:hypothetical protein
VGADTKRRKILMMYVEKFVGAVKCKGKFLRDKDGVVKIPFENDYSLVLKNLEGREAVVRIIIDGKDVLNGSSLVINGNSTLELNGFLNGNSVNNKFRFVRFTKTIEEAIGYDPEDSLIKIQFQFKKLEPIKQEVITTYHYDWGWGNPWNYPFWYNGGKYTHSFSGNNSGSIGSSDDTNVYKVYGAINCSLPTMDSCFTANSVSNDDLGITVKGSECNQEFKPTYVGELEDQIHTIVLRLSGYEEDYKEEILEVVGSRDKIICPTCNKKNDYESKFCSKCGTYIK